MNDVIPFGPGALTLIGLYLLSLLGIGWLGRRARKENTLRDYFLAGPGIGFFVLLLTLYATQYSGNTMFGFSGKAYRVGYAWLCAVQFMIAISISFLVIAPKLHRLAKKHAFITPTDFLNHRFAHRGINLLATAIMVTALGNYFLAQLTAMGRAMEGLTTLDSQTAFSWGVILLAGIMLAYEWLGGFRAVAWTDMIQGTVLAIGFAILLVVIFEKFGSPTDTTRKLLEIAPEKVLPPKGYLLRNWVSYLFLLGIGGALYPHAIQRVYAARDERSMRKSLAAMAFMPLFTTLVVILVGVTAAAYFSDQLDGAKSDAVLTLMIRQIQEGSVFGYWLTVIIFAAILGAIMSTGDSALLSVSSMLTKDIYAGLIRPEANQESLTKLGKMISFVLVLLLASLTIWMNRSGGKITLVQLLAMKFDMILQIAPAFMIGIHWKQLRSGPVFAGMLVGLVLALSFFWIPAEGNGILQVLKNCGFHPGLYGLIVNLAIAIGGSVLLNRRAGD